MSGPSDQKYPYRLPVMMADPRRAGSTPTAVPPPPPPPPPGSSAPASPTTSTDGVAAGVNVSLNAAGSSEDGGFKLRFCTVCASNQNR